MFSFVIWTIGTLGLLLILAILIGCKSGRTDRSKKNYDGSKSGY